MKAETFQEFSDSCVSLWSSWRRRFGSRISDSSRIGICLFVWVGFFFVFHVQQKQEKE
jgi:hypothetical protein